MATRYNIGGNIYEANDNRIQEALGRSYGIKKRPFCLCANPPIEMYIARVNNVFIIKRMPGTGYNHNPECPSYEVPDELSGLGQVMGSAIQENIESGHTVLKLNFSLSKGATRKPNSGESVEKGSVKADGSKLTIKGLLHYLWEQAGFNKWSPAMEHKRSWYVIRKYLSEAIENKLAKGNHLHSVIFIPETFSLDHKDEIVKRRLMALKQLNVTAGRNRNLMILIGEVKDLSKARFNYKMVIKHLPDYPIMLEDAFYDAVVRRFGNEIELWQSNNDVHLIVVGTFSVSTSGVAKFEELGFMNVTDNWIPYDNQDELHLLNELTKRKHHFIKSLRYNLPSTEPLATALLTHQGDDVTALYLCPSGSNEAYKSGIKGLMEESEIKSWFWDATESAMPELPASYQSLRKNA
jgi:hypothetical protein